MKPAKSQKSASALLKMIIGRLEYYLESNISVSILFTGL